MKVRLTALSTILIASTSASLSPALAERGHSARFDFAPNYYKLEATDMPKDRNASHPVRSQLEGKVPSGSGFLGVDPELLARPIAPITSTSIAMRAPAVPMTSSFKAAFGNPAQQVSPAKPIAGKLPPVKEPIASKQVSGKLLSHKRATGQSVKPALALAKPPESYGKNFGYIPGLYLPTKSSSGWSARADVSGKLLTH